MRFNRMPGNSFLRLTDFDKQAYLEEYPGSSNRFLLERPAKSAPRQVYRNFKREVNQVSAKLGVPRGEILHALSHPIVDRFLVASGRGLKAAGEAARDTYIIGDGNLRDQYIAAVTSGAIDDVRKGVMVPQNFAEEYPSIVRMSSKRLAGALIYNWLMSVVNDGEDHDLAHVTDALRDGDAETMLAMPECFKAWANFAAGAQTGAAFSFNWMRRILILCAAVHEGARLTKMPRLQARAQKVVKSMFTAPMISMSSDYTRSPSDYAKKIVATADYLREGGKTERDDKDFFGDPTLCHTFCAKFISGLTDYERRYHYLMILGYRDLTTHSIVINEKTQKIVADSYAQYFKSIDGPEVRYERYGSEFKKNIIYSQRISNIKP